jgi:tRNA threonylcarbamoyladenosine biosynthesis protein TsaE
MNLKNLSISLIEAEVFLADYLTSSSEETMVLGEKIARTLKPGGVVALRGALGAGKTCLTKGIARGLGVIEEVTSPTYTIVSEYAAKECQNPYGGGESGQVIPFYHIDAYRLSGDEDFENIGGEEIISGKGISVIEWSERLPNSIPPDALLITIEILDNEKRKISVGTGS